MLDISMALAFKHRPLLPLPTQDDAGLDPDTPEGWEHFRELAEGMLAGLIDHFKELGTGAAWQPVPDEVRHSLLEAPVPMQPTSLEALMKKLSEEVLPYPLNTSHPRFFGWVPGPGTAYAIIAKMVVAAMNTNMVGGDHSPIMVESTLLHWLAELMGFPSSSFGMMTAGATGANMYALHAARVARPELNLLSQGTRAAPGLVTVYCSAETHGWIESACEYLGLGRDALRRIPVDDQFRIRLDALEQTIETDRRSGHVPLCVIGNAGTTNSGSIDDLDGLATLSNRLGVWFHVDGAFGALARLVPSVAPLLEGMERADSLALDLHKWGFASHGVACALIRNSTLSGAAVPHIGAYLSAQDRGIRSSRRAVQPFTLGVELSRPDRSLEPWLLLQLHGVEGWRKAIERNLIQARYLAERIGGDDQLELMAPVPLNVVCFRVLDSRLGEAGLNDLNQEVMMRLQESGVAVVTGTWLRGQFTLRAAFTNHRTQLHDIDLLLQGVREHAHAVLEGESSTGR